MAGEGKNKVASSLLDLQPTAVLELFQIYPDRLDKPTLFMGFHGGALYDNSLLWQGVQYLPLAIESEGFDLLADGKLARPKIRVANVNNIVTNFLQNYKDFVNAKVIRKRVSVKFLDDANFDGGNPFGVADPTAELISEEWLMGRKVQESKEMVEFELNSPLDLENFSVNSRGVVAKFCYWNYRGEGCRYDGFPIERDDGSPFLDVNGNAVVPSWPSSYTLPLTKGGFFTDPTAEWSPSTNYVKTDVVYTKSPSIFLQGENGSANPLQTAYVCVQDNIGQEPASNPSYWQKDGCTKKLPACQKRFNEFDHVSYIQGQNVDKLFSGVRFSGARSSDEYKGPINSGLFHTHAPEVTGVLTGDFTIVGWANATTNSPYGAGVLSTTSRDDNFWPSCRFLNLAEAVAGSSEDSANNGLTEISAHFIESNLSATTQSAAENDYAIYSLAAMQGPQEPDRWWRCYSVVHSTGTLELRTAVEEGADPHTKYREIDSSLTINVDNSPYVFPNEFNGNFSSLEKREAAHEGSGALPQTFMLGAVEHYYGTRGFENQEDAAFVSTINGAIGPWAIWNRTLSVEELTYLHGEVRTPNQLAADALERNITHAPRAYSECTGIFEDITGKNLVAWWDGSTGATSIGNGLLDIHVNGYHLTGSGDFSGIEQTYQEAPQVLIPNNTYPFPRYGGYPGTDGFSYGRNTQIF
jgi:lambda family phage minor tail protein L